MKNNDKRATTDDPKNKNGEEIEKNKTAKDTKVDEDNKKILSEKVYNKENLHGNLVDQIGNIGNEENDEGKKDDSKEIINPEELKIDELETIKKEIKNTKKRNKLNGKKQTKYKEILKNLIIACLIVLYYLVLIIGMKNLSIIKYITDLKIAIMMEVIIVIILFETAYKKDNFEYAMYGIEMLAVGITTTFLLDLISKKNDIINIVFAIMVVCFTLYYFVKILVLAVKNKAK